MDTTAYNILIPSFLNFLQRETWGGENWSDWQPVVFVVLVKMSPLHDWLWVLTMQWKSCILVLVSHHIIKSHFGNPTPLPFPFPSRNEIYRFQISGGGRTWWGWSRRNSVTFFDPLWRSSSFRPSFCPPLLHSHTHVPPAKHLSAGMKLDRGFRAFACTQCLIWSHLPVLSPSLSSLTTSVSISN